MTQKPYDDIINYLNRIRKPNIEKIIYSGYPYIHIERDDRTARLVITDRDTNIGVDGWKYNEREVIENSVNLGDFPANQYKKACEECIYYLRKD